MTNEKDKKVIEFISVLMSLLHPKIKPGFSSYSLKKGKRRNSSIFG